MEMVRDLGERHHSKPGAWFMCPYCETEVFTYRARGKHSKSCGDCKQKQNVTHGHTGKPYYHVWQQMIARCTKENHQRYPNYGGRGITVCDAWKTFEGFWKDNEKLYKRGLTIDREDNDGNYEPSNVKWIPHSKNSAKTSRMRAVVCHKFVDGKPQSEEFETLAEAVRQTGTPLNTINRNIRSGNANRKGELWSYKESLTEISA